MQPLSCQLLSAVVGLLWEGSVQDTSWNMHHLHGHVGPAARSQPQGSQDACCALPQGTPHACAAGPYAVPTAASLAFQTARSQQRKRQGRQGEKPLSNGKLSLVQAQPWFSTGPCTWLVRSACATGNSAAQVSLSLVVPLTHCGRISGVLAIFHLHHHDDAGSYSGCHIATCQLFTVFIALQCVCLNVCLQVEPSTAVPSASSTLSNAPTLGLLGSANRPGQQSTADRCCCASLCQPCFLPRFQAASWMVAAASNVRVQCACSLQGGDPCLSNWPHCCMQCLCSQSPDDEV